MNKLIATKAAPTAVGPYAQARLAGDTLYASGQLGLVPTTGQLAPGGIQAQARQALQNLAAVLKAAGMDCGNVVKTTCLLADIGDFAAFNAVYAEFFGDVLPARSCFQVAALPLGGLVEIELIAVK